MTFMAATDSVGVESKRRYTISIANYQNTPHPAAGPSTLSPWARALGVLLPAREMPEHPLPHWRGHTSGRADRIHGVLGRPLQKEECPLRGERVAEGRRLPSNDLSPLRGERVPEVRRRVRGLSRKGTDSSVPKREARSVGFSRWLLLLRPRTRASGAEARDNPPDHRLWPCRAAVTQSSSPITRSFFRFILPPSHFIPSVVCWGRDFAVIAGRAGCRRRDGCALAGGETVGSEEGA